MKGWLRLCQGPIVASVIVSTTACGGAAAAPAAAAPTGIYSDLAFRAAGGDLVGMEVVLVAGPGGYFATVQCAAGEPGRPAVVPVVLDGARVTFELPASQPDCAGAFIGDVSGAGLRGRFAGEVEDRWLTRGRSYWQD